PVRVTGTLCPWLPWLGLSEVKVGAAPPEFTVNVTGLLVPAEVVTVTFCGPVGAPLAIVKVAVIWVLLGTATLLTVTPVPLSATVELPVKFVPVIVTLTTAPVFPLLGLIVVVVGGPRFTVNVTPLLVPLDVVTVTVRGPVVAPLAIVKVAVI